MPTPTKESTPKSPKKRSLPRTPRSKSIGDELGKNKTQRSITSFFRSDAPSVSRPEEDRKVQLKVKNMPACTPVVSADPITISDDEGLEQSNIENYHVKRKTSSAGTNKKRNISLSRKSYKLETSNDVSVESVESDAETPLELPKPSPPVSGAAEDELNGVSPRKRFREQPLNVKHEPVVGPYDASIRNLQDLTNDLTLQDETVVMGSRQKQTDPTFTATPLTPQKAGGSRSEPSSPKKSPKSPRKGSLQKSPRKYDGEAMSGNLALEHSILECKRYAQMALSPNQEVANKYLSLDFPEKVLLHKLLVDEWSWIRDIDMKKYEKLVPNINGSIDALRDKGFLEDLSYNEPLKVILNQLDRPELETLCKEYKTDSSRIEKDELVNSLCKFVNDCQSLKTVLTKAAHKEVRICVRIRDDTREILQKIFEASMSPLNFEGQFYSFQQRLSGLEKRMNKVVGKKLVPFVLNDYQLFLSPAQFDGFFTSVILKFELLSLKDERNHKRLLELTEEARASLMIYLNDPEVMEFLEQSPRYIWKYTAGSNYTSAMTVGIDFLKRAKKYDEAVTTLGVLLGQRHFMEDCRGHWYAEKVMIMDKQLKRPAEELYEVLMTGLREDLTPIGHLELSKKAESVINKKKNELTVEQKEQVRNLMKFSLLDHGTKKIEWHQTSGSGQRTYLNLEPFAMNSYMSEFPDGKHDEGDFMRNIILATFWPVIYMPKENMFLSKYQNAPLDWGTQAFYINRQNDVEDHILKLREKGIDGVMDQIKQVVEDYANHYSVIKWRHVSFNLLPTIKNIITCLTLDKFLKLSEYLLESFDERCHGWPDLTLWNTRASTFKLVEVKSLNDKLSLKQIVWLEKFVELGIDVEECRVNDANKWKKTEA